MVEFFEKMSGLRINRNKCTIYINSDQVKLQRWAEAFIVKLALSLLATLVSRWGVILELCPFGIPSVRKFKRDWQHGRKGSFFQGGQTYLDQVGVEWHLAVLSFFI